MNTTNEIHTVLGAGQVGLKLAHELVALGKEVRIVRRGPAGAAKEGLTWMQGDMLDANFMDEVCKGAAVVYHCANPSRYDRWADDLPPLFDSIVCAAKRSGAKLVVLDNVYMYGRAGGKAYREDTAMEPCSDKGRLRAELAQRLIDLQESGELDIAIARAADFFGPQTPQAAMFHERFFDQLSAGKKVDMPGDVDALHSYSYTPDVARALALLGTSDSAWGKIWHLPVTFQGTTREMAEHFARALNQSLRVRTVPRWMLHGIGLFAPQIRSAIEMMYQFEEDYVVDDSRFRQEFELETTDIGHAARATVASSC